MILVMKGNHGRFGSHTEMTPQSYEEDSCLAWADEVEGKNQWSGGNFVASKIGPGREGGFDDTSPALHSACGALPMMSPYSLPSQTWQRKHQAPGAACSRATSHFLLGFL